MPLGHMVEMKARDICSAGTTAAQHNLEVVDVRS